MREYDPKPIGIRVEPSWVAPGKWYAVVLYEGLSARPPAAAVTVPYRSTARAERAGRKLYARELAEWQHRQRESITHIYDKGRYSHS